MDQQDLFVAVDCSISFSTRRTMRGMFHTTSILTLRSLKLLQIIQNQSRNTFILKIFSTNHAKIQNAHPANKYHLMELERKQNNNILHDQSRFHEAFAATMYSEQRIESVIRSHWVYRSCEGRNSIGGTDGSDMYCCRAKIDASLFAYTRFFFCIRRSNVGSVVW